MLEILDIFRVVFNYVFWISFGCTCFIEFRKLFNSFGKSKQNDAKTFEKVPKPKRFIEYTYNVLAFLGIITGVIVILKYYDKLAWLLLVLLVPSFMRGISESLSALDVVFGIAVNRDSRPMSIVEKFSIIIIAYIWFSIGSVKMVSRVLDFVNQCKYAITHDFFAGLIFAFAFSVYFFLAFSLIHPIIVCFFMFLRFIYLHLPWKKGINDICEYCLMREKESFNHVSLLLSVVEKARKKNRLIRIASWLSHIFLFAVDLITKTGLLLAEWLCVFIGRLLSSARFIKRKMAKLYHFINNLSDLRVVGFSFRLALVFSLTLVVAVNRYKSIFKVQEASTAILEFVASAIIIPIMFEWVYSMKKHADKQCEK